MTRPMALGLLALLVLAPATHTLADWQPSGPVTLNIGFKAGGGADTQARLIGEEISAKLGWKFIFKNIAGKGGANLARRLKGGPTDGLTIGMAETATFAYTPLRSATPRLRLTASTITVRGSQRGAVITHRDHATTYPGMVRSRRPTMARSLNDSRRSCMGPQT